MKKIKKLMIKKNKEKEKEKNKNSPSGLRTAGAALAGGAIVTAGVIGSMVVGIPALIVAGVVVTGGAIYWSKKEGARHQQQSTLRLHIILHSALDNTDKEAKGDNHVYMRAGHAKIQSKVSHQTNHPEFNETFEVGVLPSQSVLHIEWKDTKNTTGTAEVDLKGVGEEPITLELPLKGRNAQVKLTLFKSVVEPTSSQTTNPNDQQNVNQNDQSLHKSVNNPYVPLYANQNPPPLPPKPEKSDKKE